MSKVERPPEQLNDKLLKEINSIILKNRLFLIILTHGVIYTVSYFAAFCVRFEFHVTMEDVILPFWRTLGVFLLVKLLIGYFFSNYQGWWRYVSLDDMVSMAVSTATSSAILMLARIAIGFEIFPTPRGVIVIDGAFSLILLSSLRASIRMLKQTLERRSLAAHVPAKEERVIIIGAGDSGEALVREIHSRPHLGLKVIGFLDDNPAKQGSQIRRVPVLGTVSQATEIFERHEITLALIAMPSATGQQMRKIVGILEETGVGFKTLPAIDHLVSGQVSISQIREVSIEDLLGREPVKTDLDAIGKLIGGKVVMVTGAGGSIGSELCRQVLKLRPSRLVLLEQAENSLFYIEQELLRTDQLASQTIVPAIADITDHVRMQEVFTKQRPAIIFHAAAHKHVPMMEANPGEAVKNNIFGTKTVADLANQFGVEAFVMISTDKAVNPVNVMGATKRAAETYIQAMNAQSTTKFITVRFGNVLGSAGSVIPTFKEQIRRGGPVTVTHPEMRRFFMTIPEAVQLVLQSFALGKGGEIFTLNMGEPVKIVDMAHDLIKLSGFKPGEDIEIVFTGIRPGEKLFEELQLDGEDNLPTSHPKIKVMLSRKSDLESICARFTEAREHLDRWSSEMIKQFLQQLVPEYKFEPSEQPSASAVEYASSHQHG